MRYDLDEAAADPVQIVAAVSLLAILVLGVLLLFAFAIYLHDRNQLALRCDAAATSQYSELSLPASKDLY